MDSAIGLLSAEHPTIGGLIFFGQTIWMGWLMIAAMVLTAGPPIWLGHVKMKLAEKLHGKVLYADADMNKADWMTALAAAVGVAGIGLGGGGQTTPRPSSSPAASCMTASGTPAERSRR